MLSWVTRYIASPTLLRSQIRPCYVSGSLRQLSSKESGVSNIVDDKNTFKVNLNVKHFKPDEVSVKIADNFIVIEGKHEERGSTHSYLSRHFVRLYQLPKDVDENAITSTLSSDGILQLIAPKKQSEEASGRTIEITETNKPFSDSK